VANGLQVAESAKNRNVGLAMTVLQRRLASSLYAIHRSLQRRHDKLAEALAEARRSGRGLPHPAPVGDAARLPGLDLEDEDDLDELTEEEEEALSGASTAQTVQELEIEIDSLEALIAKAEVARRHPERKLREFEAVIRNQ